jgi:acid-sensing ion channel, other
VTAVAQVCDPNVLGDIDPDNRTNCDHCAEYLRKSLPLMDTFLKGCLHVRFDQLCSEMLQEVITEEGVCYTYNGLDIIRKDNVTDDDVDWTLEYGYKNTTDQFDVYPRPGSEYPLVFALAVPKTFNDGLCKGPIQGFKVYLHLPNEIPAISKHYYLVPFKQVVQISAIPKMIITAPELRHFNVDKRQCYFSDERYLRFFKYYTQRNCEYECETNLTVSVCGCLRFDMPRIDGVKYCGISDIKCYRGIIQLNVEKMFSPTRYSDCNCLPSCTSITYDAELNPLTLSDEAVMINRKDTEYANTFR